MTRESILQTLRQALEPLPYVHALWLEGADAQQMVDDDCPLNQFGSADDGKGGQAGRGAAGRPVAGNGGADGRAADAKGQRTGHCGL